MPLSKLIPSHEGLVTPYAKIRAGFITLALERNREADPFVEEAKVLKSLASGASKPKELLDIKAINSSLLTAAGVSDKAKSHFQENDEVEVITRLIEDFLEPAGETFIDELVYRFLLTRGGTLGGKLRNLAGKMGEEKFIKTLLSTTTVMGIATNCLNLATDDWVPYEPNQGIAKRIKAVRWNAGRGDRVLLFNLTVPTVAKNVDLCLIDCEQAEYNQSDSSAHRDAARYIALGELKGGIDPAGADEHWKTANSALDRIRVGFAAEDASPKTFFVGAAIENAMAQEIYQQLEDGTLSYAANLTNRDQVVSLCQWLIGL